MTENELIKEVLSLGRQNEELNCLIGLQDTRIEKLQSLLMTIAKNRDLLDVKVPHLDNRDFGEIIQSGDTNCLNSAIYFLENSGG